jgi:MarR family transcriptional regulator, lower aerobic nicotinate degradation pathway regulator
MSTLPSELTRNADPSELTAHLGYWLRLVSNHVSYASARKLAAKDVTVAEWVLMRTLYDAPTPPSLVADRLGLTPGAITRLADRLIKKGLVLRKASLENRWQLLSLTAEGAGLVPELTALADQNEAECFSHLSDKEQRVLAEILKRTADRLGLSAVPVD